MSSRRGQGQAQRRKANPAFVPRPINSTKKEVRTQILQMAERKYLDTAIDSGTINSTGTLVQLNSIPQGSTGVTRIGDSAYYKSLVCRGRFQAIAGSTGIASFRFIVFLWKDNSTPTTAQILEDVGTDAVLVSHYTHDHKKRFKVLYDSGCQFATVAHGDPTTSASISTMFLQNILNKLVIPLNVKAEYDAGSSTDSNNRLYVARWSGGTDNVSFKLTSRLNFLDM